MSEAESKRLYYKIGEACRLLDIQPYVLRYWETEFPVLAPSKSRSGQRVYSESELAIIRRIKELLYQEGFTIAGAKKKLETEMAAGGPTVRPPAPRVETSVEPAPPEQAELELDTRAAERIETIRRGVEEALTQAREILARLR